MPRYRYLKLTVSCLEPRDFAVTELRAAVEWLRGVITDANREFVGIEADAGVVNAGPYRLAARPKLRLREIEGKTPAEVWTAFDKRIDEDRKGLAQRGGAWP